MNGIGGMVGNAMGSVGNTKSYGLRDDDPRVQEICRRYGVTPEIARRLLDQQAGGAFWEGSGVDPNDYTISGPTDRGGGNALADALGLFQRQQGGPWTPWRR